MFNKHCLLSIILLSFVCFVTSQDTTTTSEDTYGTTEQGINDTTVAISTFGSMSPTQLSSTETNTASIVTSSSSNTILSTSQTSISSSTATSTEATIASEMTDDFSNTDLSTSETSISSGTAASTGTNTAFSITNGYSNTVLSTSQTSISSGTAASTVTSAVSTGTNATYTATTASSITNINATFQYIITSSSPLQTGPITNASYNNQVQNLVNSSFSLTGVNYTILQARVVPSQAKDEYTYNLLVDILFTISSTCDLTCIDNAAITPNINISLPYTNGTGVIVSATGAPTRVSAPVYPPGGSSPGIPGQLGMGLGISLIGVLLIAEVVFLCWKYGLSNSPRREQYVLTRF